MNKAVESYLAAVPQARQSRIGMLHRLILELFPDAVVDMSYKMPTYRFGDGWVAIANQKHYVSLYTCGYHHIEKFKKQHPATKTGKGCINFRDRDALPLEDIKAVVKHAIDYPKGAPS
jgi:uncharacterized protein YdhG (YjbR/CyaY superfamily)